jgi:MFS family permease
MEQNMKIIFGLICGLVAGYVYRTWGWRSGTIFAATLVVVWLVAFLIAQRFLRQAALMLANLPPDEQKAKLNDVGLATRIDLEKRIKKIAETRKLTAET